MRNSSKVVLTIAALSVFAGAGQAITASPTAIGWGFDDTNISTLIAASYLTSTPTWMGNALPNSSTGAGGAGWDYANPGDYVFTFAGNTTVARSTLKDFNYSAWVVNNDGYNLPNGNAASTYNFANADVGGANYTLNYVPGAGDPGGAGNAIPLGNVHFFQIVQATSNFGNDLTDQVTSTVTQYFIDNGGSLTTPFYDPGGTSGTANAGTQKWLDDSPFRCENQSTPANCNADGASILLSISWQADTFIAVDMGAINDTQHYVQLYGGVNWGFNYSNNDLPEPSEFAAVAMALGLLAGVVRRNRSRA